VHGEGGQATVEWVALVLAAALVLGATAAFAGREADRGLGEAVAERITGTAREVGAPAAAAGSLSGEGLASATSGPPPSARAKGAPPPAAAVPPWFRSTLPPTRAAPPPAAAPRAVDGFRGIQGVADVAKHAWIVCLGYERWRHELEHPAAPSEALPVDVALGIVNTCFNPHDYLLEED
jgi:hypothetical protein